ncbi:SulP family inorganic anion transporter [Flammeovirga yaeyamensis]|uniref:SulP family inorganic anion transporter n=1 Tax=Flammeovirga yaeyamensis TaxID=367791 RepID=A0AAX1MZ98_9BACT|nr:SulP family inorganic anion transporter [Flammeovirga yaeyamensis]MBB3695901.1 MFS superfamily sulfate permease-like transporter [Flammeovirga yaeyamensis]NMF34590.1 SulP family inorganic anion transporter [Flammeovirga yaeyamensis]QWG00580.1 SulP family inorganic anion transporter [Flammeovirga yaeyamensis]
MKTNSIFKNVNKDFPASIVVFLVALPLCLGIALASGAPLLSGIISGIVGGVVVATFSGSAIGVSGPAAGLAVIVFHAIDDLHSFEAFLMSVVLAGVLQIILGLLKAGVIGYYFPASVIKGMLTGIGINIFFQQIPNALGYVGPADELTLAMSNVSTGPMIVCAVSLLLLILWEEPIIKKHKFLSQIPAPLVVVAFGIGYHLYFINNGTLQIMPEQLVQIPVIHNWAEFVATFHFPDFSAITNPEVHTIAFTMAIVASLETLLSVEAADKLDPQHRHTPTNRELIAQGTGNIVSGLIGGLPITQVIVRSSVNVNSGGTSKLSAIFHGVLLFVCVLAIPEILDFIPLACLAAILLQVGYKLAKPANFKMMFNKGLTSFIPFIVTVVGVVFTDLLEGIALGLLVSIVEIVYNSIKSPVEVEFKPEQHSVPIVIELSHQVSFLNKAKIKKILDQVPNNREVIIDSSKSQSLHTDVQEMIDQFINEEAVKRNINARQIDNSSQKIKLA